MYSSMSCLGDFFWALLLQSLFFLLQLLLLGILHLLFRLDAEKLGLSVQNISAEEVKLLQKALYLVDCRLITCHH